MGTTDHYALERLGLGSAISDRGYKFTDADRLLIDRLLYLGAEAHRHTGAPAGGATAVPAVTLEVGTSGGAIPAGTRVYYKVTLVDVNGIEGLPCAEVYVDTAAAVAEPPPPILGTAAGGTLLPGNYFYVLSAYTNAASTQETKALNPAYKTIPVGSGDKTVTITFPSVPAGASGWNIYRRSPGGTSYGYLDSALAGSTEYLDDGSLVPDCNRTLPVRNLTNGANTVSVSLGMYEGGVPLGFTWKIYRTYASGSYDNTLLHWVVEETSEGSGVITPTHLDTGLGTTSGAPPSAAQSPASPSAIDLANGAEVRNRLPLGLLQGIPFVVTFAFVGTQMVAMGSATWVCEFPQATIIGARAALGRGYAPVAQDLIVDVNKGTGTLPTMTTIYTNQTHRPRIAVGTQIGARSPVPDVFALNEGDCLTVDVDQVGGGATPTDRDLTVDVILIAQFSRLLSDMGWS